MTVHRRQNRRGVRSRTRARSVQHPLRVPRGGGNGAQPQLRQSDIEKHFQRDAKLVLSCAAGIRSAGACDLLDSGFISIVNMDGGFSGRRDPSGAVQTEGWSSRGFPTSAEPVAGRTYAELK